MTIYYQDDSVTLHHGDCLEVLDWLEADVLITDPPYGRNWKQGGLKAPSRPGSSPRRIAAHGNDGIANDHSTEIRDAVLNEWGGVRPTIVFGDLMLAPPSGTRLTAVYAKPLDAGLRGAIGGVRRDAEAIYLGGAFTSGIGGRSSIFRSARPVVGNPSGLAATSGGHPHAKPTDVLSELINLTPPGIIADPFAGSGSTLVAAARLGRKAIGVELEEKYCEIAARRLSQGVLDFGEEPA